jgi:hypothetical protein
MGASFIHLGHNIIYVELGRFLVRRKILACPDETGYELLYGCH